VLPSLLNFEDVDANVFYFWLGGDFSGLESWF
jgi:hypothetical protein